MSLVEIQAPSLSLLATDPPFTATFSFVDNSGNPVTVTPDAGTKPTWTDFSFGALVTMTVAADGMSASFAPKAAGTGSIAVAVVVDGVILQSGANYFIFSPTEPRVTIALTAGT